MGQWSANCERCGQPRISLRRSAATQPITICCFEEEFAIGTTHTKDFAKATYASTSVRLSTILDKFLAAVGVDCIVSRYLSLNHRDGWLQLEPERRSRTLAWSWRSCRLAIIAFAAWRDLRCEQSSDVGSMQIIGGGHAGGGYKQVHSKTGWAEHNGIWVSPALDWNL